MKKHYFYYPAVAAAFMAVGLLNLGNAGGPPAGFTGSPGDNNKTCGSNGGCHTGNPVAAQTGWITSDIPSTGYVPGTTYSITATVTLTGITKFGFQLSPQDSSGTKMGTLTAGTGTQLMGGGKYIEHTASGNTGTGSRAWTFDWTAPAGGSGEVTFYASFNAANGNGNTTGDKIFTSTLTVQENNGVFVAENEKINYLLLFPNPNNGRFTISGISGEVEVAVFNAAGALVFSSAANGSDPLPIDISRFGQGIYYLHLKTDNYNVSKPFIIQ